MSFENLITPRMVEDAIHDVLPPRPAGTVPCVGRTARGKIVWLRPMTMRQWEALGIVSVTGLCRDGWVTWHPATREDALRFATRRAGQAGKKEAAKVEGPSDDYLARKR